jgi:hypothetical protein
MVLNVEMLQELTATEEIGLADCEIFFSCCGPFVPPFPPSTIMTCFGCTFTS